MTEIPSTRIRSCRATITSGTVDMPDRVGADRPQDSESRHGSRSSARPPRVDALVDRTPNSAPSASARASQDRDRTARVMSRKRTPSSGSSEPISGLWPASPSRLIWSLRRHQVAGPIGRIQAAGGVGDDQQLGAQAVQRPDREGDLLERVPLIEVDPSRASRPPARLRASQPRAGRRALTTVETAKCGISRVRDDGRILDLVGQRPEPRAEDDPDARHDREAAPQTGGRLPNPVRQR